MGHSIGLLKRNLISKHGPVIETNHGTYAVRYSGHGLIGQVEQPNNMNKSNNLEEFQNAMKMMQIPMFNTMFADKNGTSFTYNALIPKRKNGINWKDIVPGNFSDLIWTEYYAFSELPSSLNPKSGYLQNCNSTPYSATVGRGNPLKTLPKNCGIEEFQTNELLDHMSFMVWMNPLLKNFMLINMILIILKNLL